MAISERAKVKLLDIGDEYQFLDTDESFLHWMQRFFTNVLHVSETERQEYHNNHLKVRYKSREYDIRLYNDPDDGAYDRLGTQPPNQKCKKCGRTWFNKYKVIEANHYYEDGPCESRKTL